MILRRLVVATAAMAAGTAGAVAVLPSAAQAANSCLGNTVVSDGKRVYNAVSCPTRAGAPVFSEPRQGEDVDLVGTVRAGMHPVVCQVKGGLTPSGTGPVTNWWLYTRADLGHGPNWGWLPASGVMLSDVQPFLPVQGVPKCADYPGHIPG
jgi:hypothetical protein